MKAIRWGIGGIGIALAAAACATLVHDAQVIEPGLQSGCSFLEGASGNNPWVDFTCLGAEAADRMIAAFPVGSASKVNSNTVLASDGGTVATVVTVRVLKAAFPTDAGGQ